MNAHASHRRPPRAIASRRVIGVAVAAAGLALVLTEAHMRRLEAQASAGILRLTDLSQARAVGSSVIFPHANHWIGYTIAASCTAALLIAPFFLIAAALLVTGRVGLRSGLLALVAVTAIVWLVNQFRLLLIGSSMRIWGFQTGYSRSHVLAGGVVSTLGIAIGIAVFLALMLHERRAGDPPSTSSQPPPPS